MKKIFKSVIFLFFAGMMSVNAQVNIGTGQEPVSGAILQLRDNDEATGDAANACKGLAFPRVSLSEVNELYPMFLEKKQEGVYGTPTEYYTKNKETLKAEHTGLVVYNLTNKKDDGLLPGLAIWDGEKWTYAGSFVPVTSVKISAPDEATSLNVSETLQLSAGIQPKNASNPAVTWSITGDAASISPTGEVKGLSAGKVTVTVLATAQDGSSKTDIFELKVKN